MPVLSPLRGQTNASVGVLSEDRLMPVLESSQIPLLRFIRLLWQWQHLVLLGHHRDGLQKIFGAYSECTTGQGCGQ